MKLFYYFLSHWKIIFYQAIIFSVYLVLFILYRLPLETVFYGLLLCLTFGVIIMGKSFWDEVHTYRRLQFLEHEIQFGIENLPEASGMIEGEYQRLLYLLTEELRRTKHASHMKYDSLVEYYTIWVHQIKTPIAAMRLMLQEEDTPRNKELLEELLHIEQYVEMVLTYLRLDSESSDYVFREYMLDDIIRQALHKYASVFIRKKLQLSYQPTGYTVLTDEKWLLFVIEQILSNALKYTPSGRISICMEGEGILCIRDTGIGISPQDLPRIFEKGYTGYSGRWNKRATGIGLYLCRRILDKLGHSITVESEPQKGTALKILLKRDKLEVE